MSARNTLDTTIPRSSSIPTKAHPRPSTAQHCHSQSNSHRERGRILVAEPRPQNRHRTTDTSGGPYAIPCDRQRADRQIPLFGIAILGSRPLATRGVIASMLPGPRAPSPFRHARQYHRHADARRIDYCLFPWKVAWRLVSFLWIFHLVGAWQTQHSQRTVCGHRASSRWSNWGHSFPLVSLAPTRLRGTIDTDGLESYDNTDVSLGPAHRGESNNVGEQLADLSKHVSQMQRQLAMQQQQIDRMLDVLVPGKSTFSTSSETEQFANGGSGHLSNASTTTSSRTYGAPLRVMVFIDGTWLYYSLFQRGSRCGISQNYGSNWFRRYRIDWKALPGIISQGLQDPWAPQEQQRPIEISRMSVFTSYRADTQEASKRYQLYEDLRDAGYDVHQMETVGSSEKCVDIQLAVEMVHMATVPHAYDIAVLLSGDKDFLPALVRVRQKGRKVAIVSMKSSVNRAFYETDGIKDYDMILLEDYLDQLLVPNGSEEREEAAVLHPYIYERLVWEFCRASGSLVVSSRDVGRFLKSIRYADWTLLDAVKESYSSLFAFLRQSNLFRTEFVRPNKPSDNSFQIIAFEGKSDLVNRMEQEADLTEDEKAELAGFLHLLPTDKRTAYYFTYQQSNATFTEEQTSVPVIEVGDLPADLGEDYSTFTVAKLKERCRERGLPTQGLKADLLQRVEKDVKEQVNKERFNEYLIELLREYLHASGGTASSKEVGRYLKANKYKLPSSSKYVSALTALKLTFGSLTAFAARNRHLFEMSNSDALGWFGFLISLREPHR